VAGTKSQTGLAVADKAQSAVNLVKVINALNKISDMLKARPCPAQSAAPAAAVRAAGAVPGSAARRQAPLAALILRADSLVRWTRSCPHHRLPLSRIFSNGRPSRC